MANFVKFLNPLYVKNGLLFLLWAAVFSPIFPGLFRAWIEDSNNSQGLLVPFIAIYLIWTMRTKLLDCPILSDWRGAVLLFASLIIYIIAFAGGIAVAVRSMLIFSLMGLVLYNFGPVIFRKVAFPLFFLLFMIPVPISIIGLISLPLQNLATDISAFLIQLLSIPVYQEGNMLYFSQTQLEVAEACSGIRSMMAMLMLGTLFVYMSRLMISGKIILIASTIPIAMIANITRVTGTGILAHFYGAGVARGFLHDFSGMAVFVFGLVLLMGTYLVIKGFQKPPI
jgi:exosortase